ncbi:MAG: DUF368 domain-containing protein [Acidobacteriota bacterium]|nr:DUF368 domain-containing protein [Acidobacteriota bacterium]
MQENQSALIALAVRGALGGILMGLANLVPGISGGTMLLAAGVYPLFIGAVADVSTLKLKPSSLVLLGSVVLAAVLAILLGAGPIKDSVVHHRWIMYSLFIGLTLGGAPLVWRLSQPRGKPFWAGALGGFAVMVIMAFGLGAGGSAGVNYFLLFMAGLAGAASMILPGVSGGYLVLLLGQYETLLGGIDKVKLGLLGDSAKNIEPDFDLILEALHVVIPVGIGVLIGVVGVSNLLKWLLAKHKIGTLGVLFGLLLGAVVGLWPFQQGREPAVGETIGAIVVTDQNKADIDPEDWPVVTFSPAPVQIAGAVGLLVLGLGITLAVDRLGEKLGGEDEAQI